jgi:hypothetical protein
MSKPVPAMEMLSGRIPADLYAWFAALEVEGAVTSSDKLRVLLAQLKRQHEGSMDFVSALSWFRDLGARLRHDLAAVERDGSAHSEVVTSLVEHLPFCTPTEQARSAGRGGPTRAACRGSGRELAAPERDAECCRFRSESGPPPLPEPGHDGSIAPHHNLG